MRKFIKNYYFYLIFIGLSILGNSKILATEPIKKSFKLTDVQEKKLDTVVDRIEKDLPTIDKSSDEALKKIDALPPEAFMSSMQKFRNKSLASLSGTVATVDVPVTDDSTDDKIEVSYGSKKTKNVPFNLGIELTGQDIVRGGFLGAAYGVDYLKYKNLDKIDEEILFKKILEHKDQLIHLLKKLTYTGQKSLFATFKSFFTGPPRVMNFFRKSQEKPLPDNNQALKDFNDFLHKQCITPALFGFKHHVPKSLGYMAAQEVMCACHDRAFHEEEAGLVSNAMKAIKSLEAVDATTAFTSKFYRRIAYYHNNKANKINISLSTLAYPFFGKSYAYYFNNSYATNKNSITKWMLKWAYPKASLDWLNSYWFYLTKKAIMHARFIQQSNGHYKNIIAQYCGIHGKKLLDILTEKAPTSTDTAVESGPVKSQRELLHQFIQEAQAESFYNWRSFKFTSFNRTSMFFELATLLPAVPKIYSVLCALWDFVRPPKY